MPTHVLESISPSRLQPILTELASLQLLILDECPLLEASLSGVEGRAALGRAGSTAATAAAQPASFALRSGNTAASAHAEAAATSGSKPPSLYDLADLAGDDIGLDDAAFEGLEVEAPTAGPASDLELLAADLHTSDSEASLSLATGSAHVFSTTPGAGAGAGVGTSDHAVSLRRREALHSATLRFLSARSCGLASLASFRAASLPALTALDVDHNQLVSLADIAQALPHLVHLSVANNKLADGDADGDVDGSGPDYGALPFAFARRAAVEMPLLETLRASNNSIRGLASLAGCRRLQRLYLSHNCISKLSEAVTVALGQTSSLQVLDLSCNPIGASSLTALRHLHGLVALRLRSCGIGALSEGLLQAVSMDSMPRLLELDLSGNPLTEGFYPAVDWVRAQLHAVLARRSDTSIAALPSEPALASAAAAFHDSGNVDTPLRAPCSERLFAFPRLIDAAAAHMTRLATVSAEATGTGKSGLADTDTFSSAPFPFPPPPPSSMADFLSAHRPADVHAPLAAWLACIRFPSLAGSTTALRPVPASTDSFEDEATLRAEIGEARQRSAAARSGWRDGRGHGHGHGKPVSPCRSPSPILSPSAALLPPSRWQLDDCDRAWALTDADVLASRSAYRCTLLLTCAPRLASLDGFLVSEAEVADAVALGGTAVAHTQHDTQAHVQRQLSLRLRSLRSLGTDDAAEAELQLRRFAAAGSGSSVSAAAATSESLPASTGPSARLHTADADGQPVRFPAARSNSLHLHPTTAAVSDREIDWALGSAAAGAGTHAHVGGGSGAGAAISSSARREGPEEVWKPASEVPERATPVTATLKGAVADVELRYEEREERPRLLWPPRTAAEVSGWRVPQAPGFGRDTRTSEAKQRVPRPDSLADSAASRRLLRASRASAGAGSAAPAPAPVRSGLAARPPWQSVVAGPVGPDSLPQPSTSTSIWRSQGLAQGQGHRHSIDGSSLARGRRGSLASSVASGASRVSGVGGGGLAFPSGTVTASAPIRRGPAVTGSTHRMSRAAALSAAASEAEAAAVLAARAAEREEAARRFRQYLQQQRQDGTRATGGMAERAGVAAQGSADAAPLNSASVVGRDMRTGPAESAERSGEFPPAAPARAVFSPPVEVLLPVRKGRRRASESSSSIARSASQRPSSSQGAEPQRPPSPSPSSSSSNLGRASDRTAALLDLSNGRPSSPSSRAARDGLLRSMQSSSLSKAPSTARVFNLAADAASEAASGHESTLAAGETANPADPSHQPSLPGASGGRSSGVLSAVRWLGVDDADDGNGTDFTLGTEWSLSPGLTASISQRFTQRGLDAAATAEAAAAAASGAPPAGAAVAPSGLPATSSLVSCAADCDVIIVGGKLVRLAPPDPSLLAPAGLPSVPAAEAADEEEVERRGLPQGLTHAPAAGTGASRIRPSDAVSARRSRSLSRSVRPLNDATARTGQHEPQQYSTEARRAFSSPALAATSRTRTRVDDDSTLAHTTRSRVTFRLSPPAFPRPTDAVRRARETETRLAENEMEREMRHSHPGPSARTMEAGNTVTAPADDDAMQHFAPRSTSSGMAGDMAIERDITASPAALVRSKDGSLLQTGLTSRGYVTRDEDTNGRGDGHAAAAAAASASASRSYTFHTSQHDHLWQLVHGHSPPHAAWTHPTSNIADFTDGRSDAPAPDTVMPVAAQGRMPVWRKPASPPPVPVSSKRIAAALSPHSNRSKSASRSRSMDKRIATPFRARSAGSTFPVSGSAAVLTPGAKAAAGPKSQAPSPPRLPAARGLLSPSGSGWLGFGDLSRHVDVDVGAGAALDDAALRFFPSPRSPQASHARSLSQLEGQRGSHAVAVQDDDDQHQQRGHSASRQAATLMGVATRSLQLLTPSAGRGSERALSEGATSGLTPTGSLRRHGPLSSRERVHLSLPLRTLALSPPRPEQMMPSLRSAASARAASASAATAAASASFRHSQRSESPVARDKRSMPVPEHGPPLSAWTGPPLSAELAHSGRARSAPAPTASRPGGSTAVLLESALHLAAAAEQEHGLAGARAECAATHLPPVQEHALLHKIVASASSTSTDLSASAGVSNWLKARSKFGRHGESPRRLSPRTTLASSQPADTRALRPSVSPNATNTTADRAAAAASLRAAGPEPVSTSGSTVLPVSDVHISMPRSTMTLDVAASRARRDSGVWRVTSQSHSGPQHANTASLSMSDSADSERTGHPHPHPPFSAQMSAVVPNTLSAAGASAIAAGLRSPPFQGRFVPTGGGSSRLALARQAGLIGPAAVSASRDTDAIAPAGAEASASSAQGGSSQARFSITALYAPVLTLAEQLAEQRARDLASLAARTRMLQRQGRSSAASLLQSGFGTLGGELRPPQPQPQPQPQAWGLGFAGTQSTRGGGAPPLTRSSPPAGSVARSDASASVGRTVVTHVADAGAVTGSAAARSSAATAAETSRLGATPQVGVGAAPRVGVGLSLSLSALGGVGEGKGQGGDEGVEAHLHTADGDHGAAAGDVAQRAPAAAADAGSPPAMPHQVSAAQSAGAPAPSVAPSALAQASLQPLGIGMDGFQAALLPMLLLSQLAAAAMGLQPMGAGANFVQLLQSQLADAATSRLAGQSLLQPHTTSQPAAEARRPSAPSPVSEVYESAQEAEAHVAAVLATFPASEADSHGGARIAPVAMRESRHSLEEGMSHVTGRGIFDGHHPSLRRTDAKKEVVASEQTSRGRSRHSAGTVAVGGASEHLLQATASRAASTSASADKRAALAMRGALPVPLASSRHMHVYLGPASAVHRPQPEGSVDEVEANAHASADADTYSQPAAPSLIGAAHPVPATVASAINERRAAFLQRLRVRTSTSEGSHARDCAFHSIPAADESGFWARRSRGQEQSPSLASFAQRSQGSTGVSQAQVRGRGRGRSPLASTSPRPAWRPPVAPVEVFVPLPKPDPSRWAGVSAVAGSSAGSAGTDFHHVQAQPPVAPAPARSTSPSVTIRLSRGNATLAAVQGTEAEGGSRTAVGGQLSISLPVRTGDMDGVGLSVDDDTGTVDERFEASTVSRVHLADEAAYTLAADEGGASTTITITSAVPAIPPPVPLQVPPPMPQPLPTPLSPTQRALLTHRARKQLLQAHASGLAESVIEASDAAVLAGLTPAVSIAAEPHQRPISLSPRRATAGSGLGSVDRMGDAGAARHVSPPSVATAAPSARSPSASRGISRSPAAVAATATTSPTGAPSVSEEASVSAPAVAVSRNSPNASNLRDASSPSRASSPAAVRLRMSVASPSRGAPSPDQGVDQAPVSLSLSLSPLKRTLLSASPTPPQSPMQAASPHASRSQSQSIPLAVHSSSATVSAGWRQASSHGTQGRVSSATPASPTPSSLMHLGPIARLYAGTSVQSPASNSNRSMDAADGGTDAMASRDASDHEGTTADAIDAEVAASRMRVRSGDVGAAAAEMSVVDEMALGVLSAPGLPLPRPNVGFMAGPGRAVARYSAAPVLLADAASAPSSGSVMPAVIDPLVAARIRLARALAGDNEAVGPEHLLQPQLQLDRVEREGIAQVPVSADNGPGQSAGATHGLGVRGSASRNASGPAVTVRPVGSVGTGPSDASAADGAATLDISTNVPLSIAVGADGAVTVAQVFPAPPPPALEEALASAARSLAAIPVPPLPKSAAQLEAEAREQLRLARSGRAFLSSRAPASGRSAMGLGAAARTTTTATAAHSLQSNGGPAAGKLARSRARSSSSSAAAGAPRSSRGIVEALSPVRAVDGNGSGRGSTMRDSHGIAISSGIFSSAIERAVTEAEASRVRAQNRFAKQQAAAASHAAAVRAAQSAPVGAVTSPVASGAALLPAGALSSIGTTASIPVSAVSFGAASVRPVMAHVAVSSAVERLLPQTDSATLNDISSRGRPDEGGSHVGLADSSISDSVVGTLRESARHGAVSPTLRSRASSSSRRAYFAAPGMSGEVAASVPARALSPTCTACVAHARRQVAQQAHAGECVTGRSSGRARTGSKLSAEGHRALGDSPSLHAAVSAPQQQVQSAADAVMTARVATAELQHVGRVAETQYLRAEARQRRATSGGGSVIGLRASRSTSASQRQTWQQPARGPSAIASARAGHNADVRDPFLQDVSADTSDQLLHRLPPAGAVFRRETSALASASAGLEAENSDELVQPSATAAPSADYAGAGFDVTVTRFSRASGSSAGATFALLSQGPQSLAETLRSAPGSPVGMQHTSRTTRTTRATGGASGRSTLPSDETVAALDRDPVEAAVVVATPSLAGDGKARVQHAAAPSSHHAEASVSVAGLPYSTASRAAYHMAKAVSAATGHALAADVSSLLPAPTPAPLPLPPRPAPEPPRRTTLADVTAELAASAAGALARLSGVTLLSRSTVTHDAAGPARAAAALPGPTLTSTFSLPGATVTVEGSAWAGSSDRQRRSSAPPTPIFSFSPPEAEDNTVPASAPSQQSGGEAVSGGADRLRHTPQAGDVSPSWLPIAGLDARGRKSPRERLPRESGGAASPTPAPPLSRPGSERGPPLPPPSAAALAARGSFSSRVVGSGTVHQSVSHVPNSDKSAADSSSAKSSEPNPPGTARLAVLSVDAILSDIQASISRLAVPQSARSQPLTNAVVARR